MFPLRLTQYLRVTCCELCPGTQLQILTRVWSGIRYLHLDNEPAVQEMAAAFSCCEVRKPTTVPLGFSANMMPILLSV